MANVTTVPAGPERELRSATEAEQRQQAERDAIRTETTALNVAFTAFQPLGEEARERGLRWLAQALDLRRAYNQEPPF